MKKILYFLCIAFLALFLIACDNGKECIGDDCPCVENCEIDEEEEYKIILQEYLENLIPDIVSENIDLPSSYMFDDGLEVGIIWTSSNTRTISPKGIYTKNAVDEEIILQAEVFDLSEYQFTKTVSTEGVMPLDDYKQIIEAYIPDFVYGDVKFVTRDLTFLLYNWFGNITYTSSDESVFTSNGQYCNQNPEDIKILMSYQVILNGITIIGSKEVTIEGKQDQKYLNLAMAWLDSYFSGITVVMDDLDLPNTDDLDRVRFSWKSSDVDIISHDGLLVTFESNKTCKLTATLIVNDSTATWEVTVRTHSEQEAIDYLINKLHLDVVKQYRMVTYAYTVDNLGYLPFYVNDIALSDMVLTATNNNTVMTYATGENNLNTAKFAVTSGILPEDRPGRAKINKNSNDFITVHDTGDAVMSAAEWNDYVINRDTRTVSWHFTVGDTAIFQHIPLSEIAYHAGDGSNTFQLIDTGITYQGINPQITMGSDNYLYINGQKSLISIPKVTSTSSSYYGQYANAITPAGLYTCKGNNGNYYIDKVYASTYSQNSGILYVCSGGGNRNSIGIETCINKGVDYNQVLRNTANLVAHLLDYYGINTTRVLQHRNFSGKLCPQVMIQNNTWESFMDMVEAEYYLINYLPDIKIEYTSNDLELLSNDGKILKKVSADTTVTYQVKVTYQGQEQIYNKTTIIKPM